MTVPHDRAGIVNTFLAADTATPPDLRRSTMSSLFDFLRTAADTPAPPEGAALSRRRLLAAGCLYRELSLS
ncbi:hypothetical protein C8241_14550 [Paracidovorax avenae]|nr:hypothetical protein C8241_14550 [Paracidovorax avenae]